MKKLITSLLTLFILSMFAFCADVKIEPIKIPFKTLPGGESLSLLYYYPPGHEKSQKKPAVVFYFGGGFIGGSTKQFKEHAIHLANRGLVAICPEYRTQTSHKTGPQECLKDAKSAFRWIRAHASEHGINPDKIAAGGGSAGGHLAAAIATTKGFNEPGDDLSVSCRPNLLILFNPVLDNGPENGWGHTRVVDYWQQFSPMHNIADYTPASIFFLGSEDTKIPVSVGIKWDKKIKSNGNESQLYIWNGEGHSFFNHSGKEEGGGKYYQETVALMDAFLVKHSFLSEKYKPQGKLKEVFDYSNYKAPIKKKELTWIGSVKEFTSSSLIVEGKSRGNKEKTGKTFVLDSKSYTRIKIDGRYKKNIPLKTGQRVSVRFLEGSNKATIITISKDVK